MDTTEDRVYARPTPRGVYVTLRLGLITMPLQCFKAVTDTKPVDRHLYSPAGNSVGYLNIDRVTQTPVLPEEITKKVAVTTAAGEVLVDLSDDEIEAVTAGVSVDRRSVEISQLIPLESIGDRYVPTTGIYHVRSAGQQVGSGKSSKRVQDPVAQKMFRLFLATLAARKQAALVKFPIKKGIARWAAITPDGTLRYLYFDDEVRAPIVLAGDEASKEEAAVAGQLIDLISVGTPPLTNDAKELIDEYVALKAEGKAPEIVVDVEPEQNTVVDLMASLEASVAAAKAKAEKPKAPARKAKAA